MTPNPRATGAPTSTVIYLCETKHPTAVVLHAQVKQYPRTWSCKTCHAVAQFVGIATVPTDEEIPEPRNSVLDVEEISEEDPMATVGDQGRYSLSHLASLHERRTLKQLEALLAERVKFYRARHGAK